ncbi:MAG: endonuclease V [Promethearchaeota archaeon]|jgi:deoxyribonuclease V
MTFKDELLRNDYSFEQAELIQKKFQALIENSPEKETLDINNVKIIAGVDISYYDKDDREIGVACAVNWDINERKLDEMSFNSDIITFSYKPGLLGFRECKLLAMVISKLQTQPDLVMVDGHGKIHPRRFGEAVHLGYALNIPTIGVAKHPYIGFSTWKEIERTKENKTLVWAKNPNIISDYSFSEKLGYAVCLRDGTRPVFISEGYKIELDDAVSICLATSGDHRLPEPLYLADKFSREKVKNNIIGRIL